MAKRRPGGGRRGSSPPREEFVLRSSAGDSAVKEYAARATVVNARYLRQLRAAIGARNLRAYTTLRNKARAELQHARRRLAGTAQGRRQLARLRAAHVAASIAFCKAHGIERARIRRIQRSFLAAKRLLFRRTVQPRVAAMRPGRKP